ncbi:hypothetical protein HYV84_08200 [Candidatus Woesearchaeota archaeon]|nr:hypothetical protein [Candidatus Woesearchaeota archaeon]
MEKSFFILGIFAAFLSLYSILVLAPSHPEFVGCAGEGAFCGGIAGISCCEGFDCSIKENFPDAGGICVPQTNSCESYTYSNCPSTCIRTCVPSSCSPDGRICTKDCGGPGSCKEKVSGVVCPGVYKPVCGNDGTAYPNNCEAKLAGVAVACPGQCPCSETCILKESDCPILCSTCAPGYTGGGCSAGLNRNTCSCISPPPCTISICSEFPIPFCEGELIDQGIDSQGCPLPPKCVSSCRPKVSELFSQAGGFDKFLITEPIGDAVFLRADGGSQENIIEGNPALQFIADYSASIKAIVLVFDYEKGVREEVEKVAARLGLSLKELEGRFYYYKEDFSGESPESVRALWSHDNHIVLIDAYVKRPSPMQEDSFVDVVKGYLGRYPSKISQQEVCSENDGGINPYTFGGVKGKNIGGEFVTWDDFCGKEDAWITDPTSIGEHYCSEKGVVNGDNPSSQPLVFHCINGCKGGECIDLIRAVTVVFEERPENSFLNAPLTILVQNNGPETINLNDFDFMVTNRRSSSKISQIKFDIFQIDSKELAPGEYSTIIVESRPSSPHFIAEEDCGRKIKVGFIRTGSKQTEDLVSLSEIKLECSSSQPEGPDASVEDIKYPSTIVAGQPFQVDFIFGNKGTETLSQARYCDKDCGGPYPFIIMSEGLIGGNCHYQDCINNPRKFVNPFIGPTPPGGTEFVSREFLFDKPGINNITASVGWTFGPAGPFIKDIDFENNERTVSFEVQPSGQDPGLSSNYVVLFDIAFQNGNLMAVWRLTELGREIVENLNIGKDVDIVVGVAEGEAMKEWIAGYHQGLIVARIPPFLLSRKGAYPVTIRLEGFDPRLRAKVDFTLLSGRIDLMEEFGKEPLIFSDGVFTKIDPEVAQLQVGFLSSLEDLGFRRYLACGAENNERGMYFSKLSFKDPNTLLTHFTIFLKGGTHYDCAAVLSKREKQPIDILDPSDITVWNGEITTPPCTDSSCFCRSAYGRGFWCETFEQGSKICGARLRTEPSVLGCGRSGEEKFCVTCTS